MPKVRYNNGGAFYLNYFFMDREAAVAGMFYPADPDTLKKTVDSLLESAEEALHQSGNGIKISDEKINNIAPKGLIVPHAGYIYSGATAASGYELLKKLSNKNINVFILAPSHSTYISSSVGNYNNYITPLGKVKVNNNICNKLIQSGLNFIPEAHAREHSLEVQLPFLIRTLKQFEIVPILLGETSADQMAELLQPYFIKNDSLFIISSDLSHYLPYKQAQERDFKSVDIIQTLETERENKIDACGVMGIKIIMRLALNNQYRIQLLEYSNSGETAGDKSAVVGYGALKICK